MYMESHTLQIGMLSKKNAKKKEDSCLVVEVKILQTCGVLYQIV